MAVIAATGFEAQQAATDGVAFTGTTSYSTAQHRTGAASLRCNPASAAQGYAALGGLNPAAIGFGLYIASLPSVTRTIAGQSPTDSGIGITSTGTIEYRGTSGTVLATSSALSTAAWHWIAAQWTGTGDVFAIDGNVVFNGTATGGTIVGRVGVPNTEASAIDIYIDDIIADNAGVLYAPSNVDIALPISDNTVTGVTDNNGVTTNIWQCVDNTPPAGVASANEAANAKAGMHFPASTTCNYLANLETYTTLGVGASDTVLAVQGIVRTGEDIATGTKNLQNVAALTNPTVAGSSVTAGNDGGAHGAEVGLWVTTFGTLTTSPSVTLGTSPTIRTSRTSETRLACVDFMGMLVAWTPSTAPPAANPPYTRRDYPSLLAQ